VFFGVTVSTDEAGVAFEGTPDVSDGTTEGVVVVEGAQAYNTKTMAIEMPSFLETIFFSLLN
jgi:hypothetical protein